MNLADIRKKSEESRRSAAATTVVAVKEPTLQSEIGIAKLAAFEETSLPQIGIPMEDVSDELVLSAGLTPEENFSTPDQVDTRLCSDESSSGSVPITVAVSAACVDTPPSLSGLTAPITKRQTGYNPLETILSGRESASDIDENAQFQAFSDSAANIEEYLCFRVADEEYAISIMSIKEIIKPREVTEVPRMPSFISGVISLRGVIIPVMDMRLRLSLPVAAVAGRERIVVLRRDSGFCGVLVDEVIQVARVRKTDIEDPPAVLDGIDRDFVCGLGHFENRMLILLNLETVLDISVH